MNAKRLIFDFKTCSNQRHSTPNLISTETHIWRRKKSTSFNENWLQINEYYRELVFVRIENWVLSNRVVFFSLSPIWRQSLPGILLRISQRQIILIDTKPSINSATKCWSGLIEKFESFLTVTLNPIHLESHCYRWEWMLSKNWLDAKFGHWANWKITAWKREQRAQIVTNGKFIG